MPRSAYIGTRRCPAHDDARPSMAVYADGTGYCFACGYRAEGIGNLTWAAEHVRTQLAPPPTWELVQTYQRLLWGPFRARLGWLLGRGFRLLSIEKFRFGYTGRAFVIPVAAGQKLLTLKFRRDDRISEDGPKYWSWRGRPAAGYGLDQLFHERTVLILEGELDAALVRQELWRTDREDYVAIGLPGVAVQTPALLRQILRRGARGYVVSYDQDLPGARGATCLAAALRAQGAAAGVATWPRQWGKDATEAITTVGFETWFNKIAQCRGFG